MEQFKLKTIEEFDNEFVAKIRAEKAAEKNSVIPEISKEEPAVVFAETQPAKYFNKSDDNAQFDPKPVETAVKPRPLTPIGQNPVSYAPVVPEAKEEKDEDPGESLDFSDGNYGEVYVESDEPKKKSRGNLAVKIISIVLLCATVLTFVFGCFISVFLDNNGTSLGNVCFNTMSQDIENLGVSKGDLIISSKPESPFDYQAGDLISVPATNSTGCDINSVDSVSQLTLDTANINATAVSNGYGYSTSITSSECYGVVSFYVPILGGLLNFAMENVVLVCVLFVLLSALWCLILVMAERKPKRYENN